jgi:hypothetical protein
MPGCYEGLHTEKLERLDTTLKYADISFREYTSRNLFKCWPYAKSEINILFRVYRVAVLKQSVLEIATAFLAFLSHTYLMLVAALFPALSKLSLVLHAFGRFRCLLACFAVIVCRSLCGGGALALTPLT